MRALTLIDAAFLRLTQRVPRLASAVTLLRVGLTLLEVLRNHCVVFCFASETFVHLEIHVIVMFAAHRATSEREKGPARIAPAGPRS